MKAKPKLDLGLRAYEELFATDTERANAKLPKIYDIPLELIDDFPNHPFKVNMDEDMDLLVSSIKERGLITPVTLRTKSDGRYEMVSGHRRKKACEIAGLTTIKADVKEMNRDEAIILMVESNLQRTVILTSEKAFSYKMRLEAMKRQGKRTDLTCEPLAHKKSRDILANEIGESKDQIRRYIRLTELIPEMLDMVDEGKIALRPAVEISYLNKVEQMILYRLIWNLDCTPSHAQTIRIRKLSVQGILDEDIMKSIMLEEKPNQHEKIHIRYDQIREYLPRNMSFEKTTDYIKKALKYYKEAHSPRKYL